MIRAILFTASMLVVAVAGHAGEDATALCEWELYGTSDDAMGIEALGFPTPGQTVNVSVRGAAASSAAFMVVGSAEATPTPGLNLLVDLSQPYVLFSTVTNTNGFASVAFTIPASLPAGTGLYYQWAVLDGRNLRFSNGLKSGLTPAPTELRLSVHVTNDTKISTSSASGSGVTLGDVSFTLFPGAGRTVAAELSSVGLHAENGITLANGANTGELRLVLAEAVPLSFSPESYLSFTTEAVFELSYPALLDNPGHPQSADKDVLDTPAPVTVRGILTMTRTSAGGTLSFTTTSSSNGDVVNFDGAYVDQVCKVSKKVKKKELKVKVHVVRKSDGTSPAATPAAITAQFTAANDIWCKQCCIKFTVDPVTDFIDDSGKLDIDNDAELLMLLGTNNDPNQIDVYYVNTDPGGTGATKCAGGSGASVEITDAGSHRTLAHELGHALGLPHDDVSPGNLMGGIHVVTSTKLTKAQCDKARSTNPKLTCLDELCEMNPQG